MLKLIVFAVIIFSASVVCSEELLAPKCLGLKPNARCYEMSALKEPADGLPQYSEMVFAPECYYYECNSIGDITSIAMAWQLEITEKNIENIYVTLNEIWEVLQIVENRLPRSSHGFTITVYDPCVEDQICIAKREVERLEREKEENEKIRKLIEKFRKGFVR